ncbi:hypothetical protein SBA4_1610005 [Candidatus Sulfopaludibacter sp. SbA4]|nr:hypothetical protein SBA4_1610005 [Candidatus Sulfopaludibacter sp. SbA4]
MLLIDADDAGVLEMQASEVAAGEGFEAAQHFALHIAHDFGETVDDALLDALFGGFDSGGGALLGGGDGGFEQGSNLIEIFVGHVGRASPL